MRASVDLFWLPLGAGGHFVRYNGRVYEALVAGIDRRRRYDLYHSALEVRLGEERFVIESAPERDGCGGVARGPVGAAWAGRLKLFRYEVRCWRGGVIPDIAEAVDSPHRITDDAAVARRVVELVPQVPTLVWGRDEAGTGDMWNSNSVIAWLLERSGVDAAPIRPPAGGRAPGWEAGLTLAIRGPAPAAGPAAAPAVPAQPGRHHPAGARRFRSAPR